MALVISLDVALPHHKNGSPWCLGLANLEAIFGNSLEIVPGANLAFMSCIMHVLARRLAGKRIQWAAVSAVFDKLLRQLHMSQMSW